MKLHTSWHGDSQFCSITWTGQAKKPFCTACKKISLWDMCRPPANVQRKTKISYNEWFHSTFPGWLPQEEPPSLSIQDHRHCRHEKPLTLLVSNVLRQQERIKEFPDQLLKSLYTGHCPTPRSTTSVINTSLSMLMKRKWDQWDWWALSRVVRLCNIEADHLPFGCSSLQVGLWFPTE